MVGCCCDSLQRCRDGSQRERVRTLWDSVTEAPTPNFNFEWWFQFYIFSIDQSDTSITRSEILQFVKLLNSFKFWEVILWKLYILLVTDILLPILSILDLWTAVINHRRQSRHRKSQVSHLFLYQPPLSVQFLFFFFFYIVLGYPCSQGSSTWGPSYLDGPQGAAQVPFIWLLYYRFLLCPGFLLFY